MATLYVTEFSDVLKGIGAGQNVGQIALAPGPVASQKFTISGTTAQSAAFNSATRFVRLQTDTACYVIFGSSPTALTAQSMPLAANAPEYFAVNGGDKVAAIT